MSFDAATFRAALTESRRVLRSEANPERPMSRTSRHVAPIHRYVAAELARRGLPVASLSPNPERPDGRYWAPSAQKLMDELRRSRLLRAPDTQLLLTRTEASLRRARRQVLGAYHAKEVDVSAVLEDSGPLIVISVKAPVSSVGKNAVNRYEEGIGEATNLHTRFPMLVFGFLMILPEGPELVSESGKATSTLTNVERLLLATSTRRAITDPPGSYEAAALAVVDYEPEVPVPSSSVPAVDSPLRIEAFFDTIMDLHETRNRGLR